MKSRSSARPVAFESPQSGAPRWSASIWTQYFVRGAAWKGTGRL